MNIIILASGRGSRLNKETKYKPKCLIKILGTKTLLDFISYNFLKNRNNIIVTGYKSRMIKNSLNNKNINFVQNKNYLHTNMVESLMLTKNKLKKSDLIIIYGDIFLITK